MQKLKNYFDIFNSAKTTIFTVGVIIVAVVNLWLAGKLAPIIADNRDTRAMALENRQAIERVDGKCETFNYNLVQEIKDSRQDIKEVDKKITDIYKILITR